MANVGYARVSTGEQNLDSQLIELRKRNCKKIFTDKISGAKSDRSGLKACLEYLRPEDVLVITKFDRLARSLKDLISIVDELKKRQIDVVSINDNIETNTPQGRFFFHIFGAVAEFERDIIRDRTLAGLAASRARGVNGGRKRKMTDEKIAAAEVLLKNGTTPKEVIKQLGVSKATLYLHVDIPSLRVKTENMTQ